MLNIIQQKDNGGTNKFAPPTTFAPNKWYLHTHGFIFA